MIVFNLICIDCETQFEGWFDNSGDFIKQNKSNIINCPTCNSSEIKKFLMTPNLGKKSNSKKIPQNKKTIMKKINKFKKIVEDNFDYVGDNFTEEAKKMKYGEVEERPIYGEANLTQTKELIDEEIGIVPLPWNSNKKTN